jgi:hypothetical protein
LICPQCRTELSEASVFCKECGKKLELTCRACGNDLPPESKFCLKCGHDLRMEEARTHAGLGLQFSQANDERQWEGMSRTLLGRILAKTDSTHIQAAIQQILQGITLLEELGIAVWYSLGHLWLGEVYAESGRREEALENLKKAESMFLGMGMDYWLGKVQEASARQ